jgi:hypothetical protein
MGGIVDCGITFCPVFSMLRLCWKLDDSLPLSVVDASRGGGAGGWKGEFCFLCLSHDLSSHIVVVVCVFSFMKYCG